MSESKKKPPILNPKNQVVFNKIILIYAIFYIALKAYAILFMSQWILENLIISLPILLIGILAFYFQKTKNQNWTFILLSIGTAILIRLNETEWVLQIHLFLN
jgi:hypothetical protein